MAKDKYSDNTQTRNSKSIISGFGENQTGMDVPDQITITETTEVIETETTGPKEQPERDIEFDDYALNKPKRIIIRAKLLND